MVQFGIPTPASTPKQPCITMHNPIIPSPGFASGTGKSPVVDIRGVGGRGKGKRQQSVCHSEDEVEIVRITKRKRKGESVQEGNSDNDIVCVGHTLDLTVWP